MMRPGSESASSGWRSRGRGAAAASDRRCSSPRSRRPAPTGCTSSLEVFPHNEAGIALYRKFGFVEEGRRVKHYRRAGGELWDAIVMGLPL